MTQRQLAVARLLCCALGALLLTEAQGADRFFTLRPEFEDAVRGQSPYDGDAPLPDGFSPGGGLYNPFRPTPSTPVDPFNTPPFDVLSGPSPWGPPAGRTWPAPYRYGWTPKFDFAHLPSAHTGPDVGNFSAFEFDSELAFRAPVGPDLVFTMAPEFDYRRWKSSSLFNKDFYRFGMNLQLATPGAAPWGYQITFNPSVNTDFGGKLASESVNLDANGVVFFRLNPAFQVVLGAGYLDRVDDIIIPYGGLIYSPSDLWEFQLLFPQGRISRYLGTWWNEAQWLYVGWEYHVESYQMNIASSSRNQIQMEDYRLTLGIRSEHARFTKYFEAGYIFSRDIEFKRELPGFDISDGFIVRGGIRF